MKNSNEKTAFPAQQMWREKRFFVYIKLNKRSISELMVCTLSTRCGAKPRRRPQEGEVVCGIS